MTVHVPEPSAAAVRTTCPYCGVGCGVLAQPDGHGGAAIAGDPDHPSNRGRLCSKGSALGETLGLEGRLPMLRGARASWDEALDAVAGGLSSVAAEHGPEAIAFYLSGQLLTEDYYVANKLMKGFVGSPNVDTNSRLCMASSVAGHRRAFGADTVPGCYDDLDEADLVVLVGSNAAWCHPILFRRMLDNRARRGARIVVIDPRRTATAEEADLFLALRPGTDTALFSGLLVHLAATGALDRAYIDRHTSGFDAAVERARRVARDSAATAEQTGLSDKDVAAFFALFRNTERVVTCYSQGVNQSVQGTDKVNAIINCHLATGRIGRRGTGPFSLTGQPNAMGGREVGGLANMLAAHMGFSPEEVDRVGRFWAAPRVVTGEGLKAVALFDAIADGRIKALWVMATNPAVSLPQADRVRAALRKLDLLIVSENVIANDTVTAGAHILLPAAAWGEKDGTVTNSERRISRQRAFLPPPGEAKPDWWMVTEVARRMGFGEAFDYATPADIFREHAALSAFENGGSRDFDLGGFADLTGEDYEKLEPVQWPVAAEQGGQARFFADGGFFTPDARARFVALEPPASAAMLSEAFPFRLNTGRVRDQWHTMTRTGRSARLGANSPVPFLDVNPADAARLGLASGDLARVTSRYGSAVLEAIVTDAQQPGAVFAPIHWSGETSSDGRIGALVQPVVDAFSGQPDAKATPVALAPVRMARRGFLLSRSGMNVPAGTWWARVAIEGGVGTLFASDLSVRDIAAWAKTCFPQAELAEYVDLPGDIYRCAAFADGQLVACVFVSPAEARPQWESIKALFAGTEFDRGVRRLALCGTTLDGVADPGPTICACFGVGFVVIRDAIASGAATSPEAIGQLLRAGTNCGSCVPELKRIIARELAPQTT